MKKVQDACCVVRVTPPRIDARELVNEHGAGALPEHRSGALSPNFRLDL
jgi:hypothetical protein